MICVLMLFHLIITLEDDLHGNKEESSAFNYGNQRGGHGESKGEKKPIIHEEGKGAGESAC